MQRGSRVELRWLTNRNCYEKNIYCTHVSNLGWFQLEPPEMNRDEPLSDFHEVTRMKLYTLATD
jgi:hypothetical protein